MGAVDDRRVGREGKGADALPKSPKHLASAVTGRATP